LRLAATDHRADPAAYAARWSVSRAAVDLLLDADFIDLHCDLEVPVRLFGYDPTKRHAPRARPMPFFGHTDYPRLREAGFTGVVTDIATNVFRGEADRLEVTRKNLETMKARIERFPDDLALVSTRSGYDRARAEGKLALWVALQGGNALSYEPAVLAGGIGKLLHRITLVHLTSSVLGGTSSPMQRDAGITERGRDFVAACNAARVLVDLAHSGKKTFWGALEAHDRSLPPVVTHTGVGAYPHWRNLDDDQVRAIADRGGVVGIIYQGSFLGPSWLRAKRSWIVDHLEHAVNIGGEDAVSIGTDYDGLIVPPVDLPDVTAHPLLVQDLLDRGWPEARIRKILGQNYLRVVQAIRP